MNLSDALKDQRDLEALARQDDPAPVVVEQTGETPVAVGANHSDLQNLNADDHPQYFHKTNDDTDDIPEGANKFITADQKSHLTGDGDGDQEHKHDSKMDAAIGTLTEKTAPHNDDVLVLADSEASGALKKVKVSNISSPGGAAAFTDLTDSPAAYTDQAGKVVAVKATEDGVEFIDAASGGGGSGGDCVQWIYSYAGQPSISTSAYRAKGGVLKPKEAVVIYGLSFVIDSQAADKAMTFGIYEVDATKKITAVVIEKAVTSIGTEPTNYSALFPNAVTLEADKTYAMLASNDDGSTMNMGASTHPYDLLSGLIGYSNGTVDPAIDAVLSNVDTGLNSYACGVLLKILDVASAGAYDPDNPPTTPNAKDDEFDDGSFDTSKWSIFSESSITKDEGSTIPERLNIYSPGQSGDMITGFYQTKPTGDFEIIMKGVFSGKIQKYRLMGLLLSTTANTNFRTFGVKYSEPYKIEVVKWNSATSFNSAQISTALEWPVMYYKIEHIGTTNKYYISRDGAAWEYIYSDTQTFDTVGFFVGSYNAGTPDTGFHIEFFRVTE